MNGYETLDPLAARGSFHARYAGRSWYAWVAERMAESDGARVLDIGCGPAWFWRRDGDGPAPDLLTLCDRSPVMVAEALEHADEIAARRVEGVVADAAALPFRDGAFDMVVAMHMLYHVPDPAAALAEIARVLRPGGRVFVTTVGDGDLAEIGDIARSVYGEAAGDSVAAAFGPARAQALIDAAFAAPRREDFEDRYRIASAEDLFHYLASAPPALGAGEPKLAALSRAIRSALGAAGGAIETDRRAVLISARAA